MEGPLNLHAATSVPSRVSGRSGRHAPRASRWRASVRRRRRVARRGPICRPAPRLDRDVPLLGGRRIQVDAADDVVVVGVETRTVKVNPEPRARSSAWRRRSRGSPGGSCRCAVARCRRDNRAWSGCARCSTSRRHIGLVVLWSERLEAELVGGERCRRIESDWHELIRGHDPDRTGRTGPLHSSSAGCGSGAPQLGLQSGRRFTDR